MTDILQDKAYDFALRIVKLSEYLHDKKREFVLSRKVLDSGTNIGLLIEEGKQGENKADFIQKYSVANKEAFKTISCFDSCAIPRSFQRIKLRNCYPTAENSRHF